MEEVQHGVEEVQLRAAAAGVACLNLTEEEAASKEELPVHTAVLFTASAAPAIEALLTSWCDEFGVGIRMFAGPALEEREVFVLVGAVGDKVQRLLDQSGRLSTATVHIVHRMWWYVDPTPSCHKLQRPVSFAAATYDTSAELDSLVKQLGLKALDWDTVMFNARLMQTLSSVKHPTGPKKKKEKLSRSISKPARRIKRHENVLQHNGQHNVSVSTINQSKTKKAMHTDGSCGEL